MTQLPWIPTRTSRVGGGGYRTLASRLLLPILIFVLGGCVIPVPPRAQVDILPPGTVATEPIIAVAPKVVGAGDFVSIAGAGFPANAAVYVNVETIQDGDKVATTVAVATAEDDGRFVASFFLPEEAAQSDTSELTIVAYADDAEASTTLTLLTDGVTPTAIPAEEASPTPTPLPATVAPTATPVEPATGATATVVSRGLNLRSGPGAAYAILRSLAQGDTLAVLGQSSDAYWLYVRTADGLLGWVARPFTNFAGTAPVVQQPPPPP